MRTRLWEIATVYSARGPEAAYPSGITASAKFYCDCKIFSLNSGLQLIRRANSIPMREPRHPFPFLPLFVPADRPERFAKAASSGANAVIINLEDAISTDAKDRAREELSSAAARLAECAVPVFVRVKAIGTIWHEDGVACLSALPVSGVILPEAQDPDAVERLAKTIPDSADLIAFIETPRGIARARELARVSSRLAFGSIDFCIALGMTHRRDALFFARSELVLASALAGRPAPIDGVTTVLDDAQTIADEAAYAASLGLGFGGKLLIHHRQIAPSLCGFRPPEEDIRWAEWVLAAGGGGAAALDGQIIDAPVLERQNAPSNGRVGVPGRRRRGRTPDAGVF